MSYPHYGNIKMKGKREKLLRCRCCVAWNKKRYPTEADLKKIFRLTEEKKIEKTKK
jgi:hypothetical protein